MWNREDPEPPDAPPEASVGKLVLVAGLSAVATGLITWGIDELRERFGTKPKCKHCGKTEES